MMNGDVIRIYTGNGGGLGDPAERDPNAVLSDIKNGLITEDRAAEVYGYADTTSQ